MMLLIQNHVLYSESHQKITLLEDPIHLKVTCKITKKPSPDIVHLDHRR